MWLAALLNPQPPLDLPDRPEIEGQTDIRASLLRSVLNYHLHDSGDNVARSCQLVSGAEDLLFLISKTV